MAPDPFPRLLRERLELGRASGEPFEEAWDAAVASTPKGSFFLGLGAGAASRLLRFLRDEFGRAYVGARRAKDMTAILEPRCYAKDEREAGPFVPKTCRWGAGCTNPPGHGRTGRFCGKHAALLTEIATRPARAAETDAYAYRIRGTDGASDVKPRIAA